MWTDCERSEINLAVDRSWERVGKLKISQDFVLHHMEEKCPALHAKILKIEEALKPDVKLDKALAMIAAWEMLWRQIEMKANGRKRYGKFK
jgi:hypothetical protein